MVRFTPLPPYPQRKNPHYPSGRRLSGPHSQYMEKKKKLL
jgi:hypothetical protein